MNASAVNSKSYMKTSAVDNKVIAINLRILTDVVTVSILYPSDNTSLRDWVNLKGDIIRLVQARIILNICEKRNGMGGGGSFSHWLELCNRKYKISLFCFVFNIASLPSCHAPFPSPRLISWETR